jgi:transcriptional regulator with XRE-family HTH domain
MANSAHVAHEDVLTVHRLRRLRLDQALTQEELAQAAGLSPGTVTRLEGDPARSVSPRTVRKLAKALGVPVTTLTRCGPVGLGERAEGD